MNVIIKELNCVIILINNCLSRVNTNLTEELMYVNNGGGLGITLKYINFIQCPVVFNKNKFAFNLTCLLFFQQILFGELLKTQFSCHCKRSTVSNDGYAFIVKYIELRILNN